MKILIVDDNAEVRRLIKSVISEIADETFECDDGSGAIEAYGQYRPDWVLMDVFMKVVDGLTAAETIIERYPEAKIIFVTNHTDKRTRQAAINTGAYAFFGKDDLISLIALLAEKTGISQ